MYQIGSKLKLAIISSLSLNVCIRLLGIFSSGRTQPLSSNIKIEKDSITELCKDNFQLSRTPQVFKYTILELNTNIKARAITLN